MQGGFFPTFPFQIHVRLVLQMACPCVLKQGNLLDERRKRPHLLNLLQSRVNCINSDSLFYFACLFLPFSHTPFSRAAVAVINGAGKMTLMNSASPNVLGGFRAHFMQLVNRAAR